MSIRRIYAICIKDLKDAIRDARVLIALILPLGIGIFYNLTFDDSTVSTINATIAFSAEDDTALLSMLEATLDGRVELTINQYEDPAEVSRIVSEEEASIGLNVPAGFDEAVKSGGKPQLSVIRAPGMSVGGDYVLAALEPALREMAGQSFPVSISISQAPEAEPDNVVDKIGLKTWSLAIAVMMMIALIAALAIPIVLAEEFEKKTIDALALAMPYWEVVASKAALGLFYVFVSTVLFLFVTGLDVQRWIWFATGIGLTALASLGLGLLLAGVFKNANQLNTWSGLFLTPFIVPAIVIGQPLPDSVQNIAALFPSGAGMRLILKSLSSEPLFTSPLQSVAVLLGWAAIAYLALLWQLKRRQA